MGKSEPSLVPGWLKSTGIVTGGGSSAPLTSRSDVTSSNHRSRTSNTISPFDNRLPTNSDRSSSSKSCWVSGTGSGNHACRSFNNSFRNVNREKRDEDFEPLGNVISNRTEKENSRCSHSLVSGKKCEFFRPRMALDSKSIFDEDFPSLGVEEKLVFPELRKVLSLGLNSGWTSALAEVPTINGGNSMGLSHGQRAAASSVSGPAAAGLNMAEALAQVPSRARPHPEIDEATAKTQRLEELAIKQSRQLIPLTKALVPNSSDKLKPRASTRTAEASTVAKNGHQLPSMTQHDNHSFGSGQLKSDSPKSSHGKFHVLKPAPKDATSPTSAASSRGSSSQLTFAPFVASTSMKIPNHTEHSSVKRKSASSDLKSGLPTEKRLTRAQVKSRNDFFNLIKNQASMNCSSTVLPNSDPIISSPTEMKSCEVGDEAISYPATCVSDGNMAEVTNNDDGNDDAQRYTSSKEKTLFPDELVFPDEEEAAFLRSLGWEENSGEDEALTEEEISSFYQQYMKVKPSVKGCRGVPLKILMLSESHKAN